MVLNERDHLIVHEVSRWRCILGRQVRILANFEGERACDRRLRKLIDGGYLVRKRYIYGIAGILSITSRAKKQFSIDLPIHEPRLDQIEHDIAVVDTAIYFIKSLQANQSELKTERQLRHEQGFINRNHLPDFVFVKNDTSYCVEVELNQKAKDRLEKNIKQNYTNYDEQDWVIPENKIKIKEMVLHNKNKYPNIEMISLDVVHDFMKTYKSNK